MSVYIDDHANADWIKRQRPITAGANADHSGHAMVAWYPSAEEAGQLHLHGGEDPSELHCTLVFLGDSAGLDNTAIEQIIAASAAKFPPFTAHVAGYAIFQNPDNRCLVALLDAPELEQLQQELHDRLLQVVPDMPDNHGYTAHITIKYLGDDEDVDSAWFKRPAFDVQFDSLVAKLGAERTETALTAAFDPDEPRDKDGKWSVSDEEHRKISERHAKIGGALDGWITERVEDRKKTPEGRVHIRPSGMQGPGNTPELTEQAVRIAKVLPNADVDLSQNMDPRYAQAAAESAEQFATEFPEAAAIVRYLIETDSGYPGTIALVRMAPEGGLDGFGVTYPMEHGQVGMELNPSYFNPAAGKDLDGLVEELALPSDSGPPPHATDSVKGLIDHEFGHVLDFAVGNQTRYITSGDMRQISTYASENPKEAFAEAFAMRQAGQENRLPVDAIHEIDLRITRLNELTAQADAKEAVLGRTAAADIGGETTCHGYVPGSLLAGAQPLEFGEGPGHPFRGNQWTTQEGRQDPDTLARRALSKRAGFTYHPVTGNSPTTGWAIALPQNEAKFPSSVLQNRAERTKVIKDYLDKHREEFAANPNLYLGGWNDTETGTLYLDTSVVEEDDAKAASLMAQYDQVAIYNLGTGETVMNDGK